MANFNVKIPVIQDAYWVKESDIAQVRNALNNIKSKYGAIINNISSVTGVPADIIVSVIFIESGGNQGVATTGSEKATGLMQVSPATVFDTLNIEKKQGRLKSEISLLSKYGINVDSLPKVYGSAISKTLQKALTYPEFNILMGAMYLSILIDLNSEGGSVRLDKVIVQYNAGLYYPYYHSTTWSQKADSLYKSLNSTTKAYVLKFIGKNGTMDILV